VGIHVICDNLELLQKLLDVVNDCLVLQDGAVVRKVDGGGLSCVLRLDALGVAVPFAEGLQSGDGLCK